MQKAIPSLVELDAKSSPDEGSLEIANLEERVARFLDTQLDTLYGTSFTKVVEHEVREKLQADLFAALRETPQTAMELLRQMFNGDETLGQVVKSLLERLRGLDESPEKEVLTSLLLNVAVLLRRII